MGEPHVEGESVAAADRDREYDPAQRDRDNDKSGRRDELVEEVPAGGEDDRGDGEDRQLAEGQAVEDLVGGVDVGGHPRPGRGLRVGRGHRPTLATAVVPARAASRAPTGRPPVTSLLPWPMTITRRNWAAGLLPPVCMT